MARPATRRLLYLHGFRSSPRSTKARQIEAWVRQHRPDVEWHCPQLPPSPRAAIEMLQRCVADWPGAQSSVIGSSLGGFYATSIGEQLGCRTVLLNPAVDPARDLARYIGEQQAWHSDERFFFRSEFIDELQAIGRPVLRAPERFLAVIAKGDEVLSWREMSERYRGCPTMLLEGSDHALSDFDQHLPAVMDFLGLST